LQIGHRMSDDLDFFTDKSFSIPDIRNAITNCIPAIQLIAQKPTGLSFLLPAEDITGPRPKLDVYNWAVKFIRPQIVEDNISLASPEDIAAFKLDAICYRKEKKDYIDIAVLLNKFSFAEMIAFYQEKYPYGDKRVVLTQIDNVQGIEQSTDPIMLINLDVKQAIHDIHEKANRYTKEAYEKIKKAALEKEEKIRKLLPQKKDVGHSLNKGKKPGK